MPTRSMPPPQMPHIAKPAAAPIATPQRSFGGMSDILSGIKAAGTPIKSALKRTPTSTATKSPKNSVVIKL